MKEDHSRKNTKARTEAKRKEPLQRPKSRKPEFIRAASSRIGETHNTGLVNCKKKPFIYNYCGYVKLVDTAEHMFKYNKG